MDRLITQLNGLSYYSSGRILKKDYDDRVAQLETQNITTISNLAQRHLSMASSLNSDGDRYNLYMEKVKEIAVVAFNGYSRPSNGYGTLIKVDMLRLNHENWLYRVLPSAVERALMSSGGSSHVLRDISQDAERATGKALALLIQRTNAQALMDRLSSAMEAIAME